MTQQRLLRGIRRTALSLGVVLAALTLIHGITTGAGPEDPVPVVELFSAFKTVYVNLNFTNTDQVTPATNTGGISFSRPPARIGNPPLIEVILKDKNGQIVERYNAWHPLWEFHHGGSDEGLHILENGPGTFMYGFKPAVRSMEIHDIPKQKLLATVDVVGAAVRPFCQANPSDSDCATDVGATKSDTSDPVAAGAVLTYTVPVTVHGANPAYAARVVDTLPAGVTFQSSTPSCTESPVRTLTCDLGVIDPGETRNLTIQVLVDADLVYKAGAPVTITNNAAASNPAGADSNGGNNHAAASTTVIAVADLAVDSVGGLAVPPQIILGQPATLTMRTVVSNGGPSSPIDAIVTRTASASAGASITAPTTPVGVPALAVGAPRTLDEQYTLGCTTPGYKTFQFGVSILPANAADTDPDLSNNVGATTLTIDCVVPVAINIKPGSNPNSVQLKTETQVPVGILTTRAGEYSLPLAFDARWIQPLTVRFGPSGVVATGTGGAAELHGVGHLEDTYERGARENRRDGDLDMVFHFETAASGLGLSDSEGCAKGSFLDPSGATYRFFGCDAVRFTP